MYCVRNLTKDLYYVGGDDRRLALFENIHPIPRGVSYNSYLLMDTKTVLVDTCDWSIGRQFLENVEYVLDGKKLDFLIINHVEPDHAATINEILLRWPKVKIISNEKAFMFMRQYGFDVSGHEIVVKEGDTKSFGKHKMTFVTAAMVHWPEVMVTFDTTNGVLFSADAFGTFGALGGKLFADEMDFDRDWLDDARRYYTNIVGKYGPQVQSLLRKAGGLKIKMIAPLHGPVWRKDLGYFIDKYDCWSKYTPEDPQSVMVVYGSMYGGTESAAQYVAQQLVEKGYTNTVMYDVSSTSVTTLISEAFRVSHIVLACVTYNLGIFPPMHNFLMDMKALHVQNRTIAIIENGSWAPRSGDLMTKFCDEDLKQMTIINEQVSLLSMAGENSYASLDSLAKAVAKGLKNEGEAIEEKSAPKPAAKAKAPAKTKAKAKAKK